MPYLIRISSLALIISLFCFTTTAQTIIKVEDNPYENLGRKIGFKEDKLKNITFNQIESLPDSVFRTGSSDIFNGGTNGSVWWMKLKFTNERDTKVYLVLDYGNIDHIDIFYRDSLNHVRHIRSGTFGNSKSRTIVATEYIIELPREIRGNIKEVYVRMQSVNTLLVPVKLVNGIVLTKALQFKYFWQIIYIGIAISLFLFNFLMLALTRDRLYSLYIIRIFTLFYVYVLAYLNGYAHFFGDLVSQLVLIHAHVFAAAGFIATISFNSRFLDLKKQMPGSTKFFNLLTFLWLCILIISLWDVRAYTNRITQGMVFISSVAMFYTSVQSIKRLKKGKNPFMICYALA
jgi:hypothetical protein